MYLGSYSGCRIRADVGQSGEGTWSWSEVIVTYYKSGDRIDQQLGASSSTPESFPTQETAAEKALAQTKAWIDDNL